MSNKQLATLILTLLLCVALLIWVFAPPEKLTEISESIVGKSPQTMCLDYVKGHRDLKDPDSAQLVSFTLKEGGAHERVAIRYKATNSFGAFLTKEYECNIIGGSAHPSLEQFDRDAKELGINLDE